MEQTPHGEVPGSPLAPEGEVLAMLSLTRQWLQRMPLYIEGQSETGLFETHEGLPLSNVPPERSIVIPAEVVQEITPNAAQKLMLEQGEAVHFAFIPEHFSFEDGEYERLDPMYFYEVWSSQDYAENSLECIISQDNNGALECVDLTRQRPDGTKRMHSLPADLHEAFHEIIAKLDDIYSKLVERGDYPDNPSELLDHRIQRAAREMVQYAIELAQRETERAERQVQDDFEKLQEAAVASLKASVEKRLAKVPVVGEIDANLLFLLEDSNPWASNTYNFVDRDAIEHLRITTTDGLLRRTSAQYVFDADIAQKISPIFHDRVQAVTTNVTALNVKAESSKKGPIITFTLTKEVLQRDGLRREEIESYIIGGNKYIKLRTVKNSLGQYGAVQCDRQRPLTRPQYDIFVALVQTVNS